MSDTLVHRAASPAYEAPSSSCVPAQSLVANPTSSTEPSSSPSTRQTKLIIESPDRLIKSFESSESSGSPCSSRPGLAVASLPSLNHTPSCSEFLAPVTSGLTVPRHLVVDTFTNAPFPTRRPSIAVLPNPSFWLITNLSGPGLFHPSLSSCSPASLPFT